MKSTYVVTLALLLVPTLLLPISSAQNLSPEMTVRVIYFLPWQQPPDPTINTRLDSMVKDVQTLFADQMESHGYGRKTFTLDTDAQGKTKIHRLDGQLDDKNYLEHTWKVWNEIEAQFDLSKNVYLVLIQISTEVLSGGTACGFGTGGSVRGGGLVPSSGPCFTREIVAHELGHAFGLMHDFHNDRYIMSYGWGGRNEVSPCHAEWLNDHRAFNPGKTSTSETVGVQHLSTRLAAPPNKISLRFEMTHRDGLRHAQLTAFPVAREENPDNLKILTCEHVEGRRDIVEFVTNELTPSAQEVMLNVMDVHGNISRQWIPVNIGTLLPPSRAVSISDANLAAAIRETLRLSPTASITELDMLKLKSLNAYERGITNLNGIQNAKNLKYLRLWENQIRDLTPLRELTQLTSLDLSRNQITDVRQLAGFTNLTDLYLSGNQIRDLTPIAGLTELLNLGLSDMQLTDIRLLRGFTHLRGLQLSGNQIRDLTPLAQLKQLTNLNLSGNQLTDIRQLARLTDLNDLWLANNQIRDLTPIAKLTQLAYLGISSNQIDDIQALTGLVNLKRLWMQWNQVTDVSPLTKLVRLEELWIDGNPIQDTSPLAKLKNLERIDIDIDNYQPDVRRDEPVVTTVDEPTDDEPTDDEPTDGDVKVSIPDPNLAAAVREALDLGKNARITRKAMWRLTTLDARARKIKNLTGLEHATRLAFLELRDNQIRNIRPLAKLKNLQTLVLDNNKVRNIKLLGNMTQLTWLLIGGNPIANVTPIANLTKLRGLSLWGNNVKNVNLLAGMTDLTHLWIGSNKISNITPLAKLAKLKVLSLHDNQIRDIRPLTRLKKLEELSLARNPIGDLSPLRQLLKQNPKLTVDIHPDAGPKIEGPWVWMSVPTGNSGGRAAAVSGKDWLAAASNGTVTEKKIATKGATAGTRVGNKRWTIGRLAPTGGDNITEMLNAIGLGRGDIDNHVAYGSIVLRSPRKQNTQMHVGSDDAVKVWLNGTLVHNNPVDRGASDYKESFSVTLKKGKNILLVAVYELGGWWSGFFGFQNDAAYSVIMPAGAHVAAAPVNGSLASAIPEATLLIANYPNPFNPETWIPYHLASNTDVRVNIYDAQGVLVRALTLGHQPTGYYTSRSRAAYWDGRNALGERVASGVYFYQLQTDAISPMRKMVILK